MKKPAHPTGHSRQTTMLEPGPHPFQVHQSSADKYCIPPQTQPHAQQSNSHPYTPTSAFVFPHQSTNILGDGNGNEDEEVDESEEDGGMDGGEIKGDREIDGQGKGEGTSGATSEGWRRQPVGSMKKRPRITLARGGACMTCR